uniref:Uncharacterized protein n=1 Tax=Candidatus Kentrum sp. LFY TaxID=2126342 RepID=A0A450W6U5_9GAMM|nr:MAG: hypothetical protein BECKLFY1418C_GA0070996_100173 [Candidatus Kentron sp. LFY]
MGILDPAVELLHTKIQALGESATAQDLAYLARAIESIGGRATVLDVKGVGNAEMAALVAAKNGGLQEINDTGGAKVQAVEETGTAQVERVSDEGTTQQNAIQTAGQGQVSAVQTAGGNQVQAVQSAGAAFTGLIPPDWPADGDDNAISIPEYVGFHRIPKGSLPFIFGVVSRTGDGTWGIGQFTSQLGQFYNGQGLNQLKLITGHHDWSNNYRAFRVPPSLQLLSGENGQFMYRNWHATYAVSSNVYQYPHALLGVIFVRNTTNQDITRTLNCGGACYWSSGYEGAGVQVLTPDATNEDVSAITGLSDQSLWAYSSNTSHVSASPNITIPANKTVAIVLYTSSHYYTSSYNVYHMFEHWYIHSFRSGFLTEGLEVDIPRTLKAFYNPEGSADPINIWK